MSSIYDEFLNHLKNEDKANCVQLVLKKLETNEITIPQLYLEILTPALNAIHCEEGDLSCIWREHVQTSIVKTIIEC